MIRGGSINALGNNGPSRHALTGRADHSTSSGHIADDAPESHTKAQPAKSDAIQDSDADLQHPKQIEARASSRVVWSSSMAWSSSIMSSNMSSLPLQHSLQLPAHCSVEVVGKDAGASTDENDAPVREFAPTFTDLTGDSGASKLLNWMPSTAGGLALPFSPMYEDLHHLPELRMGLPTLDLDLPDLADHTSLPKSRNQHQPLPVQANPEHVLDGTYASQVIRNSVCR